MRPRRWRMWPHHRSSLANAVKRISADPEVLAIIWGGSVSHGFARRDADIDLVIVVPDREWRRRIRAGDALYWERESATYEGGYIDGKYTCPSMLRKVAARGSEPARYAFRDARIVYSRMPGLRALLRRIGKYPVAGMAERKARFRGQLEAWKWYYYEGMRHRNTYVRQLAVSKMILFGCRLILLRNRSLYPYHKWMFREIEHQPHPQGIFGLINRMLAGEDSPAVERFYSLVLRYADAAKPDQLWAHHFVLDSELNWLGGHPPVDDL